MTFDQKRSRDQKNALRRKHFVGVTEGVTQYPKLCGCGGDPHFLGHGVRTYSYAKGLAYSTPNDLIECRQCGAVWTFGDAKPAIDDLRWAWIAEHTAQSLRRRTT